jgi:hypothetical protein
MAETFLFEKIRTISIASIICHFLDSDLGRFFRFVALMVSALSDVVVKQFLTSRFMGTY